MSKKSKIETLLSFGKEFFDERALTASTDAVKIVNEFSRS